MKILVTFAVQAEFAAWRRRGDFREVARDPFRVYATELGSSSVRVLLTGMGNEAAAAAIRWGLNSATDFCISSGFAGALRSGLRVGELLVPRVVCRAGRELAVASDGQLFASACETGARAVDRFMTTRHLVRTAQEKAILSEEADGVEMESYEVMAEAARRGVRAVTVRAVSDACTTALPLDFERMRGQRGGIRLRMLIAELLAKPQHLASLLRLARDCRMAGANLAAFLDRYVRDLDGGFERTESEMAAAI